MSFKHFVQIQTSEVVVYSLDDHMPVYYRTFPGNIPDSGSVETLLTDLRHAGFPNVARSRTGATNSSCPTASN